jgi:hypothetical protein
MSLPEYVLLKGFRELFEGHPYFHRNSSLGDKIASFLYEDLVALGKSPRLITRVRERERVLNAQNRTIGKARRRGDGTFGEIVPGTPAFTLPGSLVARGAIATIEIGTETKILAKAMIKQIDRVIGDLVRQVQQFKKGGGHPICVGLVGVNFSEAYTGYEGDRPNPTDGKKHKHPIQEAAIAVSRLTERAQPEFDEFLFLRFAATNVGPYPFDWVDENDTVMKYSAMLTRISREYERRFASE